MRTKKVIVKGKKPPLRKYVCSNPTCAKVFKKPKVVRYYACPYCLSRIEGTKQTRKQVSVSNVNVESRTESNLVAMDRPVEIETVKLEVPIVLESEEGVELAVLPEPMDLPESIKVSEPIVERPEEVETAKKEDAQCRYYFGYLQNREKGEGIPETCIECPKSVDCLLSNLYESPTAVTEIKKWYSIFK
jgi:DNA-directed RNA polymerase subunit RPC12/RpoP